MSAAIKWEKAGPLHGDEGAWTWNVTNGLLHLRFNDPEVSLSPVLDRMNGCMRTWTVREPSPENYVSLNRMSRMAYQLLTEQQITDMDQDDHRAIYQVRFDGEHPAIVSLLKVLNKTREGLLREVAPSIILADASIKSIDFILRT